MSKIVVGVGESRASRDALAWALEQARRTRATLHVLYVWSLPLARHVSGWLVPGMHEQIQELGERVLDKALAEVIGDADPGVPIEREVGKGSPALVLMEAASDADLLVIGSRGDRGFGLPLRSVAGRCAHHAPCSVAIVRAGKYGR